MISTLWPVEYKGTALLAERFFANWEGREMSPLEALVGRSSG